MNWWNIAWYVIGVYHLFFMYILVYFIGKYLSKRAEQSDPGGILSSLYTAALIGVITRFMMKGTVVNILYVAGILLGSFNTKTMTVMLLAINLLCHLWLLYDLMNMELD